MIIDGVFKNLPQQVEEYKALLKDVMKTDSFGGLVNALLYDQARGTHNALFTDFRSLYTDVLLRDQGERGLREGGSGQSVEVASAGIRGRTGRTVVPVEPSVVRHS